ncbi:PAS domain-containing hybrid sensor histidine kinase/response regulator [Lutibacter citreus]|uniref:PAS domain-containing hybrid sensor histidine kinase/response regulator n=1 Tax=Lutibacter citreus TaxID=2138210 RepID=UPI000DBEA233|nr:PAS domain S-box protein [Lutibacter citreus]
MLKSQPTYEELLIENERLRQLVLAKTENDFSLINSSITLENEVILKELKLEEVLENMNKAFFITDLEGNLINFNAAFSEFHRFKNKNECSKSIHDFFNLFEGFLPNGKALTLEEWPVIRALRGETVKNAEYVIKRIDTGESWPCTCSFAPIIDKQDIIVGSVVSCDDISEQKRRELEILSAKEKAEENEKNLKRAEEIACMGYWKLDVKTMKVSASDELLKIFEIDLEELTFDSFAAFVHPEDQVFNQKHVKAALDHGTAWKFEIRLLLKNGSIKWVSSIGEPQLNKKNKVSTIIGIVQDITERKQVDEKLIISELKYRNQANFLNVVIENSPFAMWVSDAGGTIIRANQALRNILNISNEIIIGKYNVLEDQNLYTQNFISDVKAVFNDLKRARFSMFWAGTKSGKVDFFMANERWIDVSMFPIIDEDGKLLNVVCQYLDVTDRNQTEELVLKNKNRLDYALKSIKTGAWELDLKTMGSWRTVKHDQIFGYEKPLNEWTYDMFLEHVVIEDKEMVDNKFQYAITTKTDWNFECRIIRNNDGEVRWIFAGGNLELNEQGKPIKMFGVVRDVTEQKNIEQKLINSKEKAEESDRLKSAFLANMSHEIRTPMNGILGFINLLNEPNLNKYEIEAYSKIINKSGNRLLNTINDIIDISKVESGEIDIITSKIYLNNELEELYSFHIPEANTKGISLIIEPSLLTEQLVVFTDGHKLHGILTNLIKNAIKYTETGSITFGYSLKNNFIEFFVKDTGIGIPKKRIDAIFNRFEQADIEDTRVFEGSGLGLAISKAYSEMLGGEIFVESEEGKGSKFSFTIPFIIEEKERVVEITKPIDNNLSRFEDLNLLIVDDDEISSKLLEVILEGIFKKIIFAKNGVEAVQFCKNSSEVDLVLMDIKMPEMDGYMATQEIRKFNKDLIIIAQTAYVLPGDKEKTIEVGCNDYISKPINKELLLEIISSHINKKSI